ncbi:MAG: hypothetical protein AAGF24_09455 [Cyanobacteria bacterium P01_H01_bin.121]
MLQLPTCFKAYRRRDRNPRFNALIIGLCLSTVGLAALTQPSQAQSDNPQTTEAQPAEPQPAPPPPTPVQVLGAGPYRQASSIVNFIDETYDGRYNPLSLAFAEYLNTTRQQSSFRNEGECVRWYAQQLATTETMRPGQWLLYKMGAIAAAKSHDIDVTGGLKTWGPSVMCALANPIVQPRYLQDNYFCETYVQPTTRTLATLSQLGEKPEQEAFRTYQGWIANVSNYDGCDVLPTTAIAPR